MALRLCEDMTAARWIATSDVPWYDLAKFGPAGFEAHARLLYDPENDPEGDSFAAAEWKARVRSDQELLDPLCKIMAHETTTPDDCYFLLWDGYPHVEKLVPVARQVTIPNRSY